MTPGETAQLAAAAARVDLDDEGAFSDLHRVGSHCCSQDLHLRKDRSRCSVRASCCIDWG